MDSVDWLGLVTNAVWLIGLAVGLATFSYADWKAHASGRRLREALNERRVSAALWSGGTLFCVGLALAGGQWWERLAWGVLALGAAAQSWQAGRERCSSDSTAH